MDATSEQLKTLLAVVDAGSFDRAALDLGVTPSAVSQRIRGLEESVGRTVVTRSRPVSPTPTGQTLLRYARQLRTLLTEAELELDAAQPRLAGPVTLAVQSDALASWVLDAIATIEDLSVIVLPGGDVSAAVRAGEAMAAISSVAVDERGCRTALLGLLRYRAAASVSFADRWSGPSGFQESALTEPPLVSGPEDTRSGRGKRVLRLPAFSDVLAAVEQGYGWAMVPEACIRRAGLVVIASRTVDMPQYLTRWSTRSALLDRMETVVRTAAGRSLVGAEG